MTTAITKLGLGHLQGGERRPAKREMMLWLEAGNGEKLGDEQAGINGTDSSEMQLPRSRSSG